MTVQILPGDCLQVLRDLPSESVHCVVTSPPYYGLRDYGTATWGGGDTECDHQAPQRQGQTGQRADRTFTAISPYKDICGKCGATRKDDGIGLEPTPEQHIAALVEVFREVRRVLRADGCMFLNYGDAYAQGGSGQGQNNSYKSSSGTGTNFRNGAAFLNQSNPRTTGNGYKPKDLLMMPSRVALALQADGWWLRSMMPWLKRSAMPESVTDRPATAIEYVFLLTKSGNTTFWQHRDGGGTRTRPKPDYRWINQLTGAERLEPRDGKEWKRVNLWRGRDYFWDGEAVRQPMQEGSVERYAYKFGGAKNESLVAADEDGMGVRTRVVGNREPGAGRNFRNSDLFYASLEPPHGLISGDGPLALDVNPAGYAEAHFATFPPKLIEPLIKAGTSEKGCCPECGAPWVREVETEYELLSLSGGRKTSGSIDTGQSSDGPRTRKVGKTTGWSPSCAHDLEPVVTTILDPFLGAGTTALVADRLGRNCIGIELNPEYVEMTEQRIKDDAGMFAEVT